MKTPIVLLAGLVLAVDAAMQPMVSEMPMSMYEGMPMYGAMHQGMPMDMAMQKKMPMNMDKGMPMYGAMYQGMPMDMNMYKGMPTNMAMQKKMPMNMYTGMPMYGAMYQGMPMDMNMYKGMPTNMAMQKNMPMHMYKGMPMHGAMYQGMPMDMNMYKGMPMNMAMQKKMPMNMYKGMPMYGAMYQGMPMDMNMYKGMPMDMGMYKGMPMAAARWGQPGHAMGAVGREASAEIVEHAVDMPEPGRYMYRFRTSNGIAAMEQSAVAQSGMQRDALSAKVQGAYMWTGPDGQDYKVEYEADENGFRPMGAHLHPVPVAIQRALEWNEAHPEEDMAGMGMPKGMPVAMAMQKKMMH